MSVQYTMSEVILEELANEQRLVVSSWRAAVYVRRATYRLSVSDRRWHQFPTEGADLTNTLLQMRRRRMIEAIAGHPAFNRLTVPFVRTRSLDERELLFEIHPYATLSHISALQAHGLTRDLPKSFTISVPTDGRGDLLPLGTTSRDWEGATPPSPMVPRRVMGHPVFARKVSPAQYFGLVEIEPQGYPLRCTGVERTLIDAIQAPNLCGGVEATLTAWKEARELLNLDVLVHQVERFDIAILRQRVGYLLHEMGMNHPFLERWQRTSQRGGSSRLIAANPFSSTYDERWNLSLNGPVSVLHE